MGLQCFLKFVLLHREINTDTDGTALSALQEHTHTKAAGIGCNRYLLTMIRIFLGLNLKRKIGEVKGNQAQMN